MATLFIVRWVPGQSVEERPVHEDRRATQQRQDDPIGKSGFHHSTPSQTAQLHFDVKRVVDEAIDDHSIDPTPEGLLCSEQEVVRRRKRSRSPHRRLGIFTLGGGQPERQLAGSRLLVQQNQPVGTVETSPHEVADSNRSQFRLGHGLFLQRDE